MALYNRIGRLGFDKYVYISQVFFTETITVASPLENAVSLVPFDENVYAIDQRESTETSFLVSSVVITKGGDDGYQAVPEVIAVTASFSWDNESTKVESGMVVWNLHIRNLWTASYWEPASDYWSWDI